MDTQAFEWNSLKNEINSRKHGIAFESAVEIFDKPFLRIRSNYAEEERFIALGEAQGRVIAVIYTERQERIRIISARMARKNEREIYHQKVTGAS